MTLWLSLDRVSPAPAYSSFFKDEDFLGPLCLKGLFSKGTGTFQPLGLAAVPIYGYDRTTYGYHMGPDRTVHIPYAESAWVSMAWWRLSWQPLDGVYGSTVYSNCTNIWSWYYYYAPNISRIAVWARHSCCLTSINVLIVSSCRLTRHNDIVSRLPEKIHSTATADPLGKIYKWLNQYTKQELTTYPEISRA